MFQLDHDAQTGKRLWEAILGGNVSVSTITYVVKAKQYVCVMTGYSMKVPKLATEVPDITRRITATQFTQSRYRGSLDASLDARFRTCNLVRCAVV
jgi:hypothetical protein